MKLSEYLTTFNACEEAVDWVEDKIIEQAVAECHRGDWLLWLAKKVGVDRQKLTLAKGLCANMVRHLMTHKRSIAAVDAAIAYGKGEINEDELDKADAAVAAATRSENRKKIAQICREVFGKELIEKVNEAICQHE